jgi:hypothetical protein
MASCLLLGGCQQVRDALGAPTDTELLEAVSLTESDAAEGAVFEPYEGGTEVVGEVSLDLCYGTFPSEDLRIGRNQVGIGDAAGEAWVSSEAILYVSPAEAEQAMDELEQARETCPDEPVTPPSNDRQPLTWTFTDPPDADWPQEPGVARQAYAFTVANAQGDALASTATYLQRGRMILALYATPPDSPADTLRNAPTQARFVEVMANRLAALPADALERPNPGAAAEDPDDVSA